MDTYFTQCPTLEAIKTEYRRLCKLWHPDLGTTDEKEERTQKMQEINAAYAIASAQLRQVEEREKARHAGKPEPDANDFANFAAVDEAIRTAIEKIITLPGIEIEICGFWVWVSGKTRPVKDDLKAAGYQWAPKKEKWYFAGVPTSSRGNWEMQAIRNRYGSQKVNRKQRDDEEKPRLAAESKPLYLSGPSDNRPMHQSREQLPLPGTPPSLDEEKALTMSRLQQIRRAYIPVVDFRMVRESRIAVESMQIRAPEDAANLLFAYFEGLTREHLVVMTLNQKNRITALQTVYIGSVHTTVIRMAELFQLAVLKGAPSIIVAHNHPSGDPEPSPEDVALTREIVKAGQLLDIEPLDHLIIGELHRFVGLKQGGLGFDEARRGRSSSHEVFSG